MPDADAIVAAVETAYSRAYSDADAEQLTALFAEDATVQTEWGPVLDGREEATRGLVALFATSANPDSLVNRPVLSRQVSPHVIVSHGTAARQPADGPVERFLYTRVYVEHDGQWLIAAIHMARPSDHPRPDGLADDAAQRDQGRATTSATSSAFEKVPRPKHHAVGGARPAKLLQPPSGSARMQVCTDRAANNVRDAGLVACGAKQQVAFEVRIEAMR